MRLRALRFRPTLLARVALGLAAVGLLPVLVSWLGLAEANRSAMEEQVLRTHIVAAESTAERVGAFLATRESLARGAAGNAVLQDPRSVAARETLRNDLQAWADLGVLAVAVVDPEGAEVVRAQLAEPGARTRVEAALRAAGAGAVRVTAANPPTLRIQVPLAERAGSLVIVCAGEPLRDVVRPAALDEADLVVAGAGRQVILGSLASLESLPEPLVRAALSRRSVGSGRFPRGGDRILGAFAPVPGVNWAVISIQPTRVADALVARLRRRMVCQCSNLSNGIMKVGWTEES